MQLKTFSQYERHVLFYVLCLIFIGLYTLFLSIYTHLFDVNPQEFLRQPIVQVISICIGFVFMFIFANVDFSLYKKKFMLVLLWGGTLLLLLLLIPIGITINGSTAWLDLGFTTFQPVEILRLAAIITGAYILSEKKFTKTTKFLLFWALVLFVVFACWAQNEYGLLVLILLTLISITFFRKEDKLTIFLLSIIPLSTFLFVMYFYGPSHIQTRVDVLINDITNNLSETDLETDYYHTHQLGLVIEGSGYFGNPPNRVIDKNRALPEKTTDSIFAIYASNTGFLGVAVVLILFYLFFFNLGKLIYTTKDEFGKLLAVGIILSFLYQITLNLSVILGGLQTGIPLLFFSKGGSYMLVSLLAIGILFNISRKSSKLGYNSM